ncbi:MAG: hypothetical protein ACRDZO_14480 [Egibacteraceae bacterium]
MATRKVTITLPEEVLGRIKALAAEQGLPLSTYLTRVAAHHARVQDGLVGLREWEAEEGSLTVEERARAREEIARADAIIARSRRASA